MHHQLLYGVIAVWIPVIVVSGSSATIAVDTFVTDVSRILRKLARAQRHQTAVAPPPPYARSDPSRFRRVASTAVTRGLMSTTSASATLPEPWQPGIRSRPHPTVVLRSPVGSGPHGDQQGPLLRLADSIARSTAAGSSGAPGPAPRCRAPPALRCGGRVRSGETWGSVFRFDPLLTPATDGSVLLAGARQRERWPCKERLGGSGNPKFEEQRDAGTRQHPSTRAACCSRGEGCPGGDPGQGRAFERSSASRDEPTVLTLRISHFGRCFRANLRVRWRESRRTRTAASVLNRT